MQTQSKSEFVSCFLPVHVINTNWKSKTVDMNGREVDVLICFLLLDGWMHGWMDGSEMSSNLLRSTTRLTAAAP